LLAAMALRLNLPAIQLVNYLVYPLQFALLLPFIKMGAWIFRAQPVNMSAAQMVKLIRSDLWHAMATLWTATMHALVAWFALSSLASMLLYLLLTPALRKLELRRLERSTP